MRNVLDATPTRDLHGGQLIGRQWVDPADIQNRDVLDVGCGFGWFILIALDGGARRVHGIEPSEEDLATARRFFDREQVSLTVASALELPFEDASFDTVTCWEVLEHIPKNTEQRALDEVFRVLRPGGTFYMSTPHAAPLITVGDPAWWFAGHRHYTRDRLSDFAENAGLQVEELMVRGDWWQVVATNNMYVAKWIFRRRPFFEASTFRRLDRGFLKGGGYANAFMKCRRPLSREP